MTSDPTDTDEEDIEPGDTVIEMIDGVPHIYTAGTDLQNRGEYDVQEFVGPHGYEHGWKFVGIPGTTPHADLLQQRSDARAKLPQGHPERLKAERAVRESRKLGTATRTPDADAAGKVSPERWESAYQNAAERLFGITSGTVTQEQDEAIIREANAEVADEASQQADEPNSAGYKVGDTVESYLSDAGWVKAKVASTTEKEVVIDYRGRFFPVRTEGANLQIRKPQSEPDEEEVRAWARRNGYRSSLTIAELISVYKSAHQGPKGY
jgi:hypothetical protein